MTETPETGTTVVPPASARDMKVVDPRYTLRIRHEENGDAHIYVDLPDRKDNANFVYVHFDRPSVDFYREWGSPNMVVVCEKPVTIAKPVGSMTRLVVEG